MQNINFFDLNKSYINGEWIEGNGEKNFDILNPYNDKVLTNIRLASLDQVKYAFETANDAQQNWGNSTLQERQDVLNKVIEFLNQYKDEITDVIVKETGGINFKAELEQHLSNIYTKEALKFAPVIEEVESLTSEIEGKTNYIHRLPIGVVSSISPFNLPFILSFRTIASAIALGNSVVHKPDIQIGITGGAIIAKAFEYAGLPKGVLNIVQTDISEIGDEMITNQNIDTINFTGSTNVGRHIGEIAGRNLKPVSLELGGNSPFIVLSDASVEKAVDAAIFGKFMFNGQVCMSINRIIVHKDHYEQFIQKFVERAKALPYGNPENTNNVIGPIINKSQLERAKSLISEAKANGSNIALEGTIEGNIITPYIFRDIDNNSTLAQTELFSPVVSIIKAETDEEAINIANDTEYGLSAALFTNDIESGKKYVLQIDSGMTHINDQTINDSPDVPFGGNKSSGLGRYGNPWVIDELTKPKWISTQAQYRKFPF